MSDTWPSHYTPLRYPGGKGKLTPYVKQLIEDNNLLDCHYVEPYAGGAGVALELLLHEYAAHVHINDVSRPVFAFWTCVLNRTDELLARIVSMPTTVSFWKRQRAVLRDQDNADDLQLGFATFYLNRTNRSGILNGGVIGGLSQLGEWKLDARLNRQDLAKRIELIARQRARISLTRLDAVAFIQEVVAGLPRKTLVYLDPPYFAKGKDLYYDYYEPGDHRNVARVVQRALKKQSWIVSYDNVPEIREMYRGLNSRVYSLGYSARDRRVGSEVMFFAPHLSVPEPFGVMRPEAA